MTFLIAVFIMQGQGIENPAAYFGAFLLWILHLAYHSESSSHKCRFKR